MVYCTLSIFRNLMKFVMSMMFYWVFVCSCKTNYVRPLSHWKFVFQKSSQILLNLLSHNIAKWNFESDLYQKWIATPKILLQKIHLKGYFKIKFYSVKGALGWDCSCYHGNILLWIVGIWQGVYETGFPLSWKTSGILLEFLLDLDFWYDKSIYADFDTVTAVSRTT